MIRLKYLTALSIVLTLVLSPAGIGFSQNQQNTVDLTPKELALALHPTVGQIVPYEPTHINIALRNISPDPIPVTGNILWYVKLLIAYENEPFTVSVYGRNSTLFVITEPIELQPNAKINSSEILFLYATPGLGEEKFIFDKVGTYKVKAQIYVSAEQKIESEEVKIEVQRPSPDDVTAAKIITQLAAARMIHAGNRSGGEDLLQSIVTNYPKSHFVDHAQFALGEYFSFLAGKYQYDEKKPVEAAEAARQAVEHYSAVSNRISSLKARSILAQADPLLSSPEIRRTADIAQLLRELEIRTPEADAMGLSETLKRVSEKLRASVNQAQHSNLAN